MLYSDCYYCLYVTITTITSDRAGVSPKRVGTYIVPDRGSERERERDSVWSSTYAELTLLSRWYRGLLNASPYIARRCNAPTRIMLRPSFPLDPLPQPRTPPTGSLQPNDWPNPNYTTDRYTEDVRFRHLCTLYFTPRGIVNHLLSTYWCKQSHTARH